VGACLDIVCNLRLQRWQGVDRLKVELRDLRSTAPETSENTEQYAIP